MTAEMRDDQNQKSETLYLLRENYLKGMRESLAEDDEAKLLSTKDES
jgi:hypothetical protein